MPGSMDIVRKYDRLLDQEYRNIVSPQIPDSRGVQSLKDREHRAQGRLSLLARSRIEIGQIAKSTAVADSHSVYREHYCG